MPGHPPRLEAHPKWWVVFLFFNPLILLPTPSPLPGPRPPPPPWLRRNKETAARPAHNSLQVRGWSAPGRGLRAPTLPLLKGHLTGAPPSRARALRTPRRLRGTARVRTHEASEPQGSGGRTHARRPALSPSPLPCPRPRWPPARALPPIPGWSRVPPNPHRPARARSRSPASLLLPRAPPGPALPRATAVRPHLSFAPASHRPDPPFPSVRSPTPNSCGRGASPPPREVSIDRPPPPLPADTDPPPRRRLCRPPGQRGQASPPRPPLPACTAASARVGAGEMRSAGGAHWPPSAAGPGQGRSREPAPPAAPPMDRRPPLPPARRTAPRGGAAWRTATAAPAGEAGPEVWPSPAPLTWRYLQWGSAGAGWGAEASVAAATHLDNF